MLMQKSCLMRKPVPSGMAYAIFALMLLFAFGFSAQLFAERASEGEADLFEMPLEELMEVEVTTSARRPQPIARATSAMYVITAEDIRQAGVTKLADLFRLVPGMDVVRREGSAFAVSARGLASGSNKRMQVLLDGRPLYDSFQGGVNKYELHPIFLENIERIEVVRGASGVTWGVNAMNGVINIITKKAADTQGGFGYGGFGNRELQQGYMRFGGTDGQLAWRATAGGSHDTGTGGDHGAAFGDYFRAFQSTGRADLKMSNDTTLTFTGGQKNSRYGIHSGHRSIQYMNLLWRRAYDDNTSLQIRWSEGFVKRYATTHNGRTREDMLEVQHSFVRDMHNVVWGADYTRDTHHAELNTLVDLIDPDDLADDNVSAFIEDEITLADNLWFTVGYRGHHNELTHFDWAGKTALIWEVAPKHFIRGAISRSFRRPVLYEEFAHRIDTGTTVVRQGNDALANEVLVSYELGYRGLLRENLELNIEGFINKHSNLIGIKSGKYENVLDITTYGVETAVNWRPYDWWLVRGFHAYEHQTGENKINDSSLGKTALWPVPHHKVGLTNRFYLDKSTTFNTQLFWYDTFYNSRVARTMVEPYFRFDIRLARRIWNDSAELAFGVSNLTRHFHYEGNASLNEVPRQFYFQFFYKF